MTKSLLQLWHGVATLFCLELTLWSQTRFKARVFRFFHHEIDLGLFMFLAHGFASFCILKVSWRLLNDIFRIGMWPTQ